MQASAAATSLRRHHRRRHDVTLLWLASCAALTLGLTQPLLYVEKMVFWENSYSVAAGVFGLWDDGEWFLAVVVFFFSIVFPIAKLGMLGWLWFLPARREFRRMLLTRLEQLGRWSMLDVFIVAILVVATKLGALASVEARPGVYWFGAAVLASMILTQIVVQLARRVDRAR